MRYFATPFLIGCFLFPSFLRGEDAKLPDSVVAGLSSPDEQIRRDAASGLQTYSDPRIPALCLPLLQDSGSSIQRLALRALGSRYAQIPLNEIPAYVQAITTAGALQPNTDVARIAERAAGLLKRDYQGEMFAPNPQGTLVIYERRGLPCVISVSAETEILIGKRTDDYLFCFRPWIGNAPVKRCVWWHPDGTVAALDMIFGRHHSGLWLWYQKGDRMVHLSAETFRKELGVDSDVGFVSDTLSFREWRGSDLIVSWHASLATPAPDSEDSAISVKSGLASFNLTTGLLTTLK